MSETQESNVAPEALAVRRVLVIEDDLSFGQLLKYQLERAQFEPHLVRSGEEGLARLAEIEPDVVLSDVMLPGKNGCAVLAEIRPLYPEMPVIMMTAAGSVEMAVDCMKQGAYDFITKPFDFDRLRAILRNALEFRELKLRVRVLEGALVKTYGFDRIIARAANMRLVVDQARRASASNSDVLILGESGSGKEVLARAVHFNSARKNGPFVAINCGAIPETLLESELFGHEKGAFTGAVNRRIGCFEQANGGTLFLDEIGEMRLDMQVRLLRALENREIRRVGGERTVKINARVISASNQNITANIGNNLFRPDLYYRLAILVLEIPPLRERAEDVPALAHHFLSEAHKEGHTRATRFAPAALDVLMKYHWPGNVRELRNAVERAVVFEDGNLINFISLPPDILRQVLGPQAVPRPKLTETYSAQDYLAALKPQGESGAQPPALSPSGVLSGGQAVTEENLRPPADDQVLTLDEEEKRVILRTLALCGGNVTDAARRLGVHRSTLHRKMTRFGLAIDEQFAAETVEI